MLVADIRRAVAEHYRLTDADLLGKSRQRCIARPRQVAMYLARELTGQSLPRIGSAFNRDHTTVCHAIATVRSWEGQERVAVNRLANRLRPFDRQRDHSPVLAA